MAKHDDNVYIHEDVNSTVWYRRRATKIAAIAAGGLIVLSGTFAAGAITSQQFDGRPGTSFGLDRDGDHRGPGGFERDADKHGERDGGFQLPTEQPTK